MGHLDKPTDTSSLLPRSPRNRLLAALPASDMEHLRSRLHLVPLRLGQVLQEPQQQAEHAFFIELGIASLQIGTAPGDLTEVGVVGRMGMIGTWIVLGRMRSPLRGVVHVPGEALQIRAAHLRTAMLRSPALRRILLSYTQSLMVQTSQLVLCNAQHPIDGRVARWLLLARDRLDSDDVRITHDLLSRVLGVRRASVTEAVGRLVEAGAVLGDRGLITIRDRPRLERLACSCYEIIRSEYDRMLALRGEQRAC